MIKIDNRALFIGVNDYRTFDETLHHPAGTSDLHGSRNDAHAFWRVCRELGIPAENMRILTSPELDPEDLGAGAEQVGVATEAAILKGIEWLGMATARRGQQRGARPVVWEPPAAGEAVARGAVVRAKPAAPRAPGGRDHGLLPPWARRRRREHQPGALGAAKGRSARPRG